MSDSGNDESKIKNKLFIRGCVTNSVGIMILILVAKCLNLGLYVSLSVGIQFLVFFFHGLPKNSERFYDISGSVTHFVLVAACLIRKSKVRSPRQILMALVSIVWMTRLGTFLFVRISKDGKDGRFDALKRHWLSFLGAWTFQATWVVLIQLPVLLINELDDSNQMSVSFCLVDMAATVLWIVGFLIEFVADVQKFTFRAKESNKDKFINTGLWKLSRHPNYFGEISMWVAMALLSSFTLLAHGRVVYGLASWLSPAFTALLLLKISGVPMVEKAGEKKWGSDPDYIQYMQNTPCIIPGIKKMKTI